MRFALTVTVVYGTVVAVPVIAYLLAADLIASRLAVPWNLLVYVALGCLVYAAALYFWKGRSLRHLTHRR